ncbi:hypothetical protein CBER1_09421 [Cercospora berteroae]|uniref:Uncharacterized protein n=1 Tax=Cercospora berteroae TaxID=357750 RepID=A0A2S6CDZ8_9PEZI|nr:hypothetical protein CBER1_09421 [Cercospora berteroae]
MTAIILCFSALQILLTQGLPLDNLATASQTVAYGLPIQYVGKSSVWDGNAISTNYPQGTYTGGSCYVRDDDGPTPSTLYRPEAASPVSALTAATSCVNGTRSEDCTTGEDSTFYSTYAPVETISSIFQTRPEVTRTVYPQQSSGSLLSQPQTTSSIIASNSQGKYPFSNTDTTFSNEITSTTWDAFPTSPSTRSDFGYATGAYIDSQYNTAVTTIAASQSRSYGPAITTWTDSPTFTSDDRPRTSEAYPRPIGYGDESSRSYDYANSNTGTWSFSFTSVDNDPTQTTDPTSESATLYPTSNDHSTNSYFYGQPLPSMSSLYDYGSSTSDSYASQSRIPQSTWTQQSVYPDPEISNTFSHLRANITQSATTDTTLSRWAVYPEPSSSFTIVRDPIITISEFSHATWSQQTIYPDPSVSFSAFPEPSTSQIDFTWSTHTNYPDADGSSNAVFDPTHTRSDFVQPTQSQYTVYPESSNSATFKWDPTFTQTESWSQYTAYPAPSSSNKFTWDPTVTETETWSQYTAYSGPISSNIFYLHSTVTQSTSWIYPTAYWQPTSDRSGLPTATPVRDPNH